MENETLGRFGHHPDPATDFCEEVEHLESIAENARLGLTGVGEATRNAMLAEYESLDARIGAAMEFRVGADACAVNAKAALRKLATVRGFTVTGEASYAGQPLPRASAGCAA